MENVLDLFRTDAYGLVSMISRFDSVQFTPGQAMSLGIWTPESISTTTAVIELRDQMLSLLDPSDRGAPGAQIQDQNRVIKALVVPHIQHNSRVTADEIAGVREFGTGSQFQTAESVINRKLQIGGNNFDGTEEYLAINALQGIVKTPNTTITNLYTLFGVTKETTFTLPITASNAAGVNGNGAILTKFQEIVRKTRDNVRLGALVPRVWMFATPELMTVLTAANEVRTNFQRFREMASLGEVGAFLREGSFFGTPPWYYGGVWIEEYRGSGLPANGAITFPIMPPGAPTLYPYYYAPADYMETVNTMGRPRYAKVAVDPSGFNKFVDLEMQMNPLPICLRPTSLMTVAFS